MTELRSNLTCPRCGETVGATMPSDACQWFFECPSCDAVIRPLERDCCVFCSYGDVPCPPVQKQRLAGRNGKP